MGSTLEKTAVDHRTLLALPCSGEYIDRYYNLQSTGKKLKAETAQQNNNIRFSIFTELKTMRFIQTGE